MPWVVYCFEKIKPIHYLPCWVFSKTGFTYLYNNEQESR